MDSATPGARRLLLVHAHPDDETIGTGITMARYVDEGAVVTLVTCTRGEEGEVLVPDLAHLAANERDELGTQREQELADAMSILGVTDHQFLGGAGTYRDSGMMQTPSNERAECFWRADLLDAACHLVSVIRQNRPHVLVTYDDFGQYGHPDHIQAHRVAMYAAALSAAQTFRPDLGKAWDIAKIYWTALPKSFITRGMEQFLAAGGQNFFGMEPGEELPWATDDSLVTTRISDFELEPRKIAALRAHQTQVEQDGEFFTFSELVGPEAMGTEFFRIVKGSLGEVDADGYESDLFSGTATGG